MKKTIYFSFLIVMAISSCTSKPETPSGPAALSKDSVVSLAKAAFIYAMPLALMDITKKNSH